MTQKITHKSHNHQKHKAPKNETPENQTRSHNHTQKRKLQTKIQNNTSNRKTEITIKPPATETHYKAIKLSHSRQLSIVINYRAPDNLTTIGCRALRIGLKICINNYRTF